MCLLPQNSISPFFCFNCRLLLTTEIAKQAGYDCVFVGDTASSLAVDLLSDIALGRGSQIFLDTVCLLKFVYCTCT